MFEEMLGDMRGMIRMISLAVVCLALVRRGEFDGDVDARADERGGGAQGDRLQPPAGPLHGLDRGGAGRRPGRSARLRWVRRRSATSSTFPSISGGFLPFYYVPWNIALQGLAISLFIGLASGLYPAVRAANLSVIDGLRRVV